MDPNSNVSLHETDQHYYLPTFKRYPIAFDRGEGCYLYDVEGKRYLDALAGIAVNNVGYSHPKVVKAIQEQAAKVTHISNFFASVPQVRLAQKLVELSGLSRVFFTSSGAESLEGAIKVARKYANTHGRGGTVLSFTSSFHGRTMATIATGQKKYQQGFDPIPGGFRQLPFMDIDAVRQAIGQDTAAILIEPIQGEGGINPTTKEFLQQLRDLCDEHNLVLIFDEVQCGVGRTGQWFAKDHYGVTPDIMTLAKGLGGGVPIGAILTNEKTSAVMAPGDHGTTYGGNPLVCAASLATLEVIEEENLLAQVRENGAWVREQVLAWNEPSVKEVRGAGLMIGIVFDFETKPLVADLLEQGFVTNATADHVLRLVPPLIITREQLGTLLEAIHQTVKKHTQQHA